MTDKSVQLMACSQCDALQRVAEPANDGAALCYRCGATVKRGRNLHSDELSALALLGIVLFCVGNFSPLLLLNAQGNTTASSFFRSTMALWDQDYHAIAVVVFLTTVVMPGVILGSTLYLTGCVSLRERGWIRRFPLAFEPVLRLAQGAREWSMIEVFMVGALVSFVKLAGQVRATVYAGPALWSCALLVVVLTFMTTWFHPRDLWEELPQPEDSDHAR